MMMLFAFAIEAYYGIAEKYVVVECFLRSSISRYDVNIYDKFNFPFLYIFYVVTIRLRYIHSR